MSMFRFFFVCHWLDLHAALATCHVWYATERSCREKGSMWIFRVIDLSIFCPFVMTATTMAGNGWTCAMRARQRWLSCERLRDFEKMRTCEWRLHSSWAFTMFCVFVRWRARVISMFFALNLLSPSLSLVRPFSFHSIQFNPNAYYPNDWLVDIVNELRFCWSARRHFVLCSMFGINLTNLIKHCVYTHEQLFLSSHEFNVQKQKKKI